MASGKNSSDIVGLSLQTDVEMNKVSPDFLRNFAISLHRPDAGTIFLSCGALRSLEVMRKSSKL